MASKAHSSNPLVQLLTSSTTDNALRLQRVLSTTPGIDATLMLTGYTLTFASAQVTRLLQTRLTALAEAYAARASKSMSPGETLIATLQLPNPAARLADAQLSMRTFAGMCSDVRAFMRLWSALAIWGWAKRVVLAPPADPLLRIVAYGQVLVNAGYVAAEHGAYLAGKGVYRNWTPEQLKRGWIVAGQFFGAHLALDFVRLWRTSQLQQPIAYDEKEAKIARAEENRLWWKSLITDAAYSPMAIHLSYESGFINEEVSGVLGIIIGYLSFREVWNKAA